jgi:hypothetical protein
LCLKAPKNQLYNFFLNHRKNTAGVIKRRRSRRRGSEDSDEENPDAEGEVKEGKEGKEGGKEGGKGKGKGKKKEKLGLDDPEKLRRRGNKLNKSQRKKSNPKKKEDEAYVEDIDAQVNEIFSAVR